MRWFQVDSDTPDDPKIQALIRKGLLDGGAQQAAAMMGRLFLLWCYTANHGAGDPGYAVRADGSPLPMQEMADYCLLSVDDLAALIDFMAAKEHVDAAAWKDRRIVWFPGMSKRADAYARSKGRGMKRANQGESGRIVPQVPPDSPLHTTPHPTIPDQTQKLVDLWNAERKPGPALRDLTVQRRQKFARALKAKPDLADWLKVIQWANGQAWCNAPGSGSNPTWRMALDFLAKPGKLAEYLDRVASDGTTPDGPRGRDASRGRVGFEPGKFAGLERDDDA